ncbi:CdaR family protein [Selenomonas sp. TAMA-11512]|uniref:CdaR family protein n=1 Tax=Selenomonas sp. TAMA-11512 TaxID=3095337 RepID=UPI00308E6ABE|nr:CdaR family protein [Selenomonas sp. TAMA-11512]
MMTKMRQLIQRNLLAKVIALVVAIVLWLYVMNEQNPTIEGDFVVPIELTNVPDEYRMTQSVKSAKIYVRGARSNFVSASPNSFKAIADLTGLESGSYDAALRAVMPQGFELVSIEPATVHVELDQIISRNMPVEIVQTGMAGPDVTVAKIEQEYPYVKIEGPASLVNRVAAVVGYIALGGNKEDFSTLTSLNALDAEGRSVSGVEITPVSMQIKVQLARGLAKKVVTVHPVLDGVLPDGLTLGDVTVVPLKIEVAGSAETLEKIVSIDTAKVLLSNFTAEGKHTIKSELLLPKGVTVTNPEVSLTVEVRARND